MVVNGDHHTVILYLHTSIDYLHGSTWTKQPAILQELQAVHAHKPLAQNARANCRCKWGDGRLFNSSTTTSARFASEILGNATSRRPNNIQDSVMLNPESADLDSAPNYGGVEYWNERYG